MPLDCLLMTRDATVLRAVQTGLSVYEVNLEVRKDVASALEIANRRHFDGFVIDCDGVPGGLDVLTAIRHTSANRKQSVILAIVNGATGISTAFDSGAQFVLGKPLDKARLRPFLENAIPRWNGSTAATSATRYMLSCNFKLGETRQSRQRWSMLVKAVWL